MHKWWHASHSSRLITPVASCCDTFGSATVNWVLSRNPWRTAAHCLLWLTTWRPGVAFLPALQPGSLLILPRFLFYCLWLFFLLPHVVIWTFYNCFLTWGAATAAHTYVRLSFFASPFSSIRLKVPAKGVFCINLPKFYQRNCWLLGMQHGINYLTYLRFTRWGSGRTLDLFARFKVNF